MCFFHRKHGLKSARAELLLESNPDVTIASLGAICLKSSVVLMVVVNCNYAVMGYLLYLIVSNFG